MKYFISTDASRCHRVPDILSKPQRGNEGKEDDLFDSDATINKGFPGTVLGCIYFCKLKGKKLAGIFAT